MVVVVFSYNKVLLNVKRLFFFIYTVTIRSFLIFTPVYQLDTLRSITFIVSLVVSEMIKQLVQMHESLILKLRIEWLSLGGYVFLRYRFIVSNKINVKMGQKVVIQYAKLPNLIVLDSCSSSCFPLLLHSVCYTILSVLSPPSLIPPPAPFPLPSILHKQLTWTDQLWFIQAGTSYCFWSSAV